MESIRHGFTFLFFDITALFHLHPYTLFSLSLAFSPSLSPPTPLSGLQTEEMHKFRRISIPVRLSVSRQGLAPFRLSSSRLSPPSRSPLQHYFESFKQRCMCRPTFLQTIPKLFLGIMIFLFFFFLLLLF